MNFARLWKDQKGIREIVLHEDHARRFFDFTQKNRGFVYIMKNPAVPDLLKVGRTAKNPFVRALTLKTAGALGSFEPVWVDEFCNAAWAETLVHQKLNAYCHDREWFRVDLDLAKQAISETKEAEVAILQFLGGPASLLRDNYETWSGKIDIDGLIEHEHNAY